MMAAQLHPKNKCKICEILCTNCKIQLEECPSCNMKYVYVSDESQFMDLDGTICFNPPVHSSVLVNDNIQEDKESEFHSLLEETQPNENDFKTIEEGPKTGQMMGGNKSPREAETVNKKYTITKQVVLQQVVEEIVTTNGSQQSDKNLNNGIQAVSGNKNNVNLSVVPANIPNNNNNKSPQNTKPRPSVAAPKFLVCPLLACQKNLPYSLEAVRKHIEMVHSYSVLRIHLNQKITFPVLDFVKGVESIIKIVEINEILFVVQLEINYPNKKCLVHVGVVLPKTNHGFLYKVNNQEGAKVVNYPQQKFGGVSVSIKDVVRVTVAIYKH